MNRDMKLIMENWRGFVTESEKKSKHSVAQKEPVDTIKGIQEAAFYKMETMIRQAYNSGAITEEQLQEIQAKNKSYSDKISGFLSMSTKKASKTVDDSQEEVILLTNLKKAAEELEGEVEGVSELVQAVKDGTAENNHAYTVALNYIKNPKFVNKVHKYRLRAAYVLTGLLGYQGTKFVSDPYDFMKEHVNKVYTQWSAAMQKYAGVTKQWQQAELDRFIDGMKNINNMDLSKFSDAISKIPKDKAEQFAREANELGIFSPISKLVAKGKEFASRKIGTEIDAQALELKGRLAKWAQDNAGNLQQKLEEYPLLKQALMDSFSVQKMDTVANRTTMEQLEAVLHAAWGFLSSQTVAIYITATCLFVMAVLSLVKNIQTKDTSNKVLLAIKAAPLVFEDLKKVVLSVLNVTGIGAKLGAVIDGLIKSWEPELKQYKRTQRVAADYVTFREGKVKTT